MSNLDDLKKQVEYLTKQNQDLQTNMINANNQIKGLTAQCKAAKQLCDELTNSNIIMRTNLLLHQEHSAQRDAMLQQLQQPKPEAAAPSSPSTKDSKAA